MPQTKWILIILLMISSHLHAQDLPSIYVNQTGYGKHNLIFISGMASSSSIWDEAIRSLSPGFTAYSISFAGFAGNKPQPKPDLDLWISEISQFIQLNKIEKPALIGHSLGGVIAMELAAKNPGIFSKIMIIDAFPCLSALYNPAFKPQDTMNLAPYINHFKGMDSVQFRNMYGQMVSDSSRLPILVNWALKTDAATMGTIYGSLLNKDLRIQLSDIDCPLTVLLQPAMRSKEEEIRVQFGGINKLDIHFASKGLHFIMYDDRDWFLNSLHSFLRS